MVNTFLVGSDIVFLRKQLSRAQAVDADAEKEDEYEYSVYAVCIMQMQNILQNMQTMQMQNMKMTLQAGQFGMVSLAKNFRKILIIVWYLVFLNFIISSSNLYAEYKD